MLLFMIVLFLFITSSFFTITGINVVGNNRCKTDEIIDLSNIKIGNNGFKTIAGNLSGMMFLRYASGEQNIKKNCPYIKNVTARYIIPNTFVITVEERNPVAAVPLAGTNYVIDTEGYIVEERKYNTNYPQIDGLNPQISKPGELVNVKNRKELETGLELLDIINRFDENKSLSLLEQTKSINVKDINNMTILLDNRITVNIGGLENIQHKIQFLRITFFEKIKKTDKGHIDFTLGKNPVFTPQ